MEKCQIRTKKMETGGNAEVWHIVWLNVVIDGEKYELKDSYDIEDYLIEAEWVGKQYETMSAEDFTEKYTLDMITGTKEKIFDLEAIKY